MLSTFYCLALDKLNVHQVFNVYYFVFVNFLFYISFVFLVTKILLIFFFCNMFNVLKTFVDRRTRKLMVNEYLWFTLPIALHFKYIIKINII